MLLLAPDRRLQLRPFNQFVPPLALLFSAPLIAEFLLGDFNIRQLAYLGIFVPLYGAVALFVREMVRRTGRGWPTMLLSALVCGLIYEGLVNQTLFNPNFAGAHLLKYGFIPSLGTSFNYAAFILTLHTVWSISTPIALAEGLAGERSREPWLNVPALVVVGLLALLGLAGTAASTIARYKFVSSPMQYASISVLILIVIYFGFRVIKKPQAVLVSDRPDRAPSQWLVSLVAFGLSSAFMIWFHYAPDHQLDATLGLAVLLALDALGVIVFAIWARRSGWGAGYIVAAGAGAVMTYGWFGLRRLLVSGHTAMGIKTTPIDVVGQVALLLVLLAMYWVAIRKQGRKP